MSGHTFLYLGRGEFAPEYLSELETLPCCTLLIRGNTFERPDNTPWIDIVLLEAGPTIAQSGKSLPELIQAFDSLPVVALTKREHEHRGIAAVRAGAKAYICVDDVTVEEQDATFDHVVQRSRMQQRLSETDVNVLSVLRNINDGVIVVDEAGHVLDINPAARTILGLGPRSHPDPTWEQTFCCFDEDGNSYRNAHELPLVRARSGEKFINQVAIYRAPEQPDILLSLNGQGLYDGNRELVGGVVTFRDVTEQTHRTSELEKLAQFDELTGLANRSLFTEQLGRAIGRAERKGAPLATLFIDFDRFKSVNDTLGHDVGDALLVEVAERLRSNVRIGDFTARWGGDEFVVCLEDFGEATNAGAAAQKLLLVLTEKYVVGNSEVYATPSIGIALYPDSGDSAERMVRAADIAMYEAKKRGGGRFQYYSPSLNARLEQREELEVGLRHALVRHEFMLHYQPRIDLTTGRMIGLEALLRWQHPRFGLLPPARFLSILESSGLIHSAGEWVIATACRQLAAWQQRFEMPDLSVSINLSSQQLLHKRLVDFVKKTLNDTMLDPGCVEFEIADGDAVQRRTTELDTLRALRKLGVRLSLDQFGTIDVSFESLDKGFIDSCILDRNLVADIMENDSHQRIVRAAIAMAQGLDIEVAAEGIETVSQLEFLKSCNCDLAQGFLISRPMQPEKVAAVLRSEIAGTSLLERPMP
ncbi:MAG: EAL domain-containing protein [Gammaproteobacteria bacterium]|nr:EAL domain-containing protein [Gammaproteobacteria bacterium]MBT8093177.1 EAL domain-containing protein [Gammaproteobacteria bacterium]NNF50202.1 EAL domain-containing protein [Woeseiaceae bacterium]